MLLEGKKQFVKEFSGKIKDSKSLILVNYQGISVNNINELRRKLKAVNSRMQIIKNRLALRAIDDSGIESYAVLKDYFNGPVAVIIGDEDPTEAIKIYKEYTDQNKLMEFKVAVISDRLIDSSQIVKVANLPSREVMIAKTVMMLNAPISGFYNSLAGIIKKFCYVLNDLKIKIESGEVKTKGIQVEESVPEEKVSDEVPPVQESIEEETVEGESVKDEGKQESTEESTEENTEENKKENTEVEENTVKEENNSETGDDSEKQEG